MLRNKIPDTGVIPLMNSECSNEDDDSSTDNDTDLDNNGSYFSEEDEADDPEPAVSRRRRPWERSEEDLLRECMKRNEPWNEIGKQLDRLARAACQHWRLMREKEGKGSESPKKEVEGEGPCESADVAAFADDESMLIERTLSDTGPIDGIAITPLMLYSWLLIW
jgi:hypothetical protein